MPLAPDPVAPTADAVPSRRMSVLPGPVRRASSRSTVTARASEPTAWPQEQCIQVALAKQGHELLVEKPGSTPELHEVQSAEVIHLDCDRALLAQSDIPGLAEKPWIRAASSAIDSLSPARR